MNKGLKLLLNLLHLPTAIWVAFKWSRVLDLISERKFLLAYGVLVSFSKYVSKQNVEHLLVRGFLACMTKNYDDSANSLDAFFSVVDSRDRYSEEEKKYLKKFAAEHYLIILPAVNSHSLSEESLTQSRSFSIDMLKVRKSLQRKFPL